MMLHARRSVSTRSVSTLSAALAIFLGACGGPEPPGPQGAFLSGSGTATIDGVLGVAEWQDADRLVFDAVLPGGGTTPATLYVMNDADSIYIAVEYAHTTVESRNHLNIQFPPRVSGPVSDQLLVTYWTDPALHSFDDIFVSPSTGQAPRDIDEGGTEDGGGVFASTTVVQTYELSHPLDSDDDLHDFSYASGDTVGLCVTLKIGSGFYNPPCSDAYIFSGGTTPAEPEVADFCRLFPGAPHCTSPLRLEPNRLALYCIIRDCAVVDWLPRNCLVKFDCPGCDGIGYCPPFYEITLRGLGGAWTVDLVDREGARFPHERTEISDGVVLRFQPTGDEYLEGSIGRYALVFRPATEDAVGRVFRIGASLEIAEGGP